MLVLTPKPAPTESLMGFVLRLSETNGYETPWHVLKIAGFDQGEMKTAGFPVKKLAGVLGDHGKSLAPIAYCSQDSSGLREFQLLGHSLGKGVAYKPLRLTKPTICPDCIGEDGYIDAFFDLSIATACPKHGRNLVTLCPQCRSPLTWFRPGLLHCQCGASFGSAPVERSSPALLDLMHVFWAKLHGSALQNSGLQEALPVEHLMSMPLRTLLVMLPALGRFGTQSASDTPAATERAATILSDWPNGFHRFLEAMRAERPARGTSLRKRFEGFYGKFFKQALHAPHLTWLREEFVQFGLKFADDAIVDSKILRSHKTARRFVTQSELARRLSVRPITVSRWIAKGLVPAARIDTPLCTRFVIDSKAVEAVEGTSNSARVFQGREAARYLAIPVSVLSHLKKCGRLGCRHRPRHKGGYHQDDLDEFMERLNSLSIPICRSAIAKANVVSLARALSKYRFHDTSRKAELVTRFLSGDLVSIGRTGRGAANIFFHQEDIASMVAGSRLAGAGGALTQSEAAKYIGCDIQAIASLIKGGFLMSHFFREGTRISHQSVKRFVDQYIALSRIAAEQQTTSRRLVRLCEGNGISVIRLSRTTGTGVSFIRVECHGELLEICDAHPGRKKIQNTLLQQGPRVVAAMRTYLQGLTGNGERLPRRGKRPNLWAIARACGFDRKVLYENKAVRSMLDAHAAAEAQ